ncbi:MAG: 3'-5' exonuclease [Thiogranum sp.]|nr:3'-5' exonuclease [Thiogranum sp.]
MATHQDLIETLTATGNYKVIRRLEPVAYYHEDAAVEKKIGLYLDTEATGMELGVDRIIELAMVPFEYDAEGRLYRILPAFNAFQDPGMPIPPFITGITGITDEMVAGHSIDLDQVAAVLEGVSIIIAHNARFDRPFVETLHAGFESIPWACSIADINWNAEGFEGVKLEYLAYKHGFFYEGHRATVDCMAGIELLSQRLPSGDLALKRLLDSAGRTDVRLWAERAPFEMKDRLRLRGYRWSPGGDGARKAWYRDLPEDQVDEELLFLNREVYTRAVSTLPMDRFDATLRYSNRL